MTKIQQPGTEIVVTISEEGMFVEHLCRSTAFSFEAGETRAIGRAIQRELGLKDRKPRTRRTP